MVATSSLVGYVRKVDNALKLSVSVEAFKKAEKHKTQDGREFVSLIINENKMLDIIRGDREVTSLCQVIEG